MEKEKYYHAVFISIPDQVARWHPEVVGPMLCKLAAIYIRHNDRHPIGEFTIEKFKQYTTEADIFRHETLFRMEWRCLKL